MAFPLLTVKKIWIGTSVLVILLLLTAVIILFQLPFRYDRDLGSLRVLRLDEIPPEGEPEASFYIDTSGDQACVWQCPKVGLGVKWRKNKTEVRQLFRSCRRAGFGDSFVDGAICDRENFLLQMTDAGLVVLNIEKQAVLKIRDPAQF